MVTLLKQVLYSLTETFKNEYIIQTYIIFTFQAARMALALLFLLLAGPLMLTSGGPVQVKATNQTIPLVLWHGMGMQMTQWLS